MAPLLIIGIDGLPPALLRRLAAEGHVPALAGLIDRGSLAVLRSTPNYQSASAWTSMVTGVNPGRHGIFHFSNPTGGYEAVQIDARHRRSPSMWRLLSDEGVRVAVLNVPVSWPVEAVEGVMIAGWLCPTPRSPGFAHPPELAGEIARRFGDYPMHPDVRRHAVAGRYEEAARAAVRGIDFKARVATWVLTAHRPDVLCVVFTESDSWQHWSWHLMDPDHPEHDAEQARRWREALPAPYRALDRAVRSLLEAAGDDADVLVCSDHGQAPNSGGQVLLRPWLTAAGYLVPRRRSGLRRASDALMRWGFGLVRARAPNRLKAVLRARLPGLQTRAQAGVRGVAADWRRTRAWTEAGHLFVNLRGRRPQGVVEPGDAYDALLEELCAGLRSLVDEETGRHAVARITRGADEFEGPFASIMPDLLVHWPNDLRLRRLLWRGAAGECLIERHDPPQLPTGAHHPDGTLVAAGPSFRRAAQPRPRSIYDVAPTVLHLLGQAVASWFDGRVMTELLTEAAAEDVCVDAVKKAPEEALPDAGVGDEEIVRQRLRSLGYIE